MALRGRLSADPSVEDGCCYDEEAENDNLYDETTNDDVISHVDAVDIATG